MSRYTSAYCSGNTVYVLNEFNMVARQFSIDSVYEPIGPAILSGDTITVLVEPKDKSNAHNKKIMTYTATGVFKGMHMA